LAGWLTTFRQRSQHLFFRIDQCCCVVAGKFKPVAVRDGVSGTGFDTITTEDATVVVDIVDAGIALSAAEANDIRVFRRFDVDAISRTGGSAEKTSDALLKPILVALQNVGAAIAILQLSRAVRVLFCDGRLQHLFESDAHSLGDRRGRTNHFTDFCHLYLQGNAGICSSRTILHLHYDGVVRAVVLFLLAASLVLGDTFKLFLKDGGFHLVREYQVQGDRVRYYSTERGDWEEIPVALVDLGKTEQQRKARQEEQQEVAREQDEEDKALREQRREIASIPMDPGGYYDHDGQVKALKLADYQVITSKKRKTIQILSPIPLVPGKASVVIKGAHSDFVVNEPRPNFYMRLVKEERFGIIRLTPKKDARLVEDISIVPVSKQALEERKQMDTFEQQLADGLYKVWPEKPLEPGEYALVEYTQTEDQQDIELLVWDFAVSGATK
jgi:hypothetical protein